MLDGESLTVIRGHGIAHRIGLCTCPCYDAIVTVGAAIGREADLRLRMAIASPEALAALTIGAADPDQVAAIRRELEAKLGEGEAIVEPDP